MAWAPDGRLFVAELHGVVRVAVGGKTLPEPLIDISDHVNRTGDRGLLGIAVDADFETNHYLYLLYVHEDGKAPADHGKTSRLTRVVVRPDNTVANPSSPETVILGSHAQADCPPPDNNLDCIPADYIAHSIGTVRADPDGTLWVGVGDASIAGQTDTRALRTYDERSYAGKILHVDRQGRGLPEHAFCPSDADLTHICTKVYARGFRNPYRFALRGGGLGPIVGDVGMSAFEEINLTAAGRNYGWPCWEGPNHTPSWGETPECAEVYAAGGTTAPDFAYAGAGTPTGGGTAIVGGPTYPGGDYPDSFDGEIFYGDWAHGFIRRVRFGESGPVAQDFLWGAEVLDLQIAPNGNLAYVDAAKWEDGAGLVAEIAYCPANCAPLARAEANPSFGPTPLTVGFNSEGSSDPDGDPVSYDWDFGDGTARSTHEAPVHTYATAGVYHATLTVEDSKGLESTATVPITVGNTPPEPSIDAPADGTLYSGGERIQLKGSALDPEDGAVPADDLEWRVLLHHGDHTHPHATLAGDVVEFTPGTDHDADSYFTVTLRARDSEGLTAERSIDLKPRTTDVQLASEPPGAPLTWVNASVSAPYSTVSAAGFRTSVSAAQTFEREGRIYTFDHWSDSGERQHHVEVPASGPFRLVAHYRDTTPEEPPPRPGPDQAPAGPEGDPPRDQQGPLLAFNAARAARDAASGRLRGSATDASGIAGVDVALRARRLPRAACIWWLRKQGRLAHRAEPCSRPRWITTRLTVREPAVDWLARLGGRVPPGAYELLVRARDSRGNVTRDLAGTRRISITLPQR
jgi:glucose/arabinose dehydrogenase/PKD repeat protein